MVFQPALDQLIQELVCLAQEQFPVNRVNQLLREVSLPETLFKEFMFFKPASYTRNLIYHSEQFELLLLCWDGLISSSIHGHEGEKCWMRVISGELLFTNYKEDSNGSLEIVGGCSGNAGYVDGPAVIHKVENRHKHQAISMHLYARPFTQCDTYIPGAMEKTKIQLGYDSLYGRPCK